MIPMFDPMYFVFLAPGLILSLWASWRVKSNFRKYSAVRSMRGLTGAQAAAELLRQGGVRDVRIERSHGLLSDHYNPVTRTLALSDGVYGSTSVAAIGIASNDGVGMRPATLSSMLSTTDRFGCARRWFPRPASAPRSAIL